MIITGAERLTDSLSWFRFWMPYCFTKLEHPRLKHVWLPLNRNYKPLGSTTDRWVDYQEFLDRAVAFKADPAALVGIWKHHNSEHLYLYVEGAQNLTDYFERLERLMDRRMDIVEGLDLKEYDERAWDHGGRNDLFAPKSKVA